MHERLHIQRRKTSHDQHPSHRSLGDRLTNPTPGQPLDHAARATLEPRFGHSFADVRVHTDSDAHQLAHEVEARAFTTGQHIYFRSGTYDPQSPGGLHLLAHELTHTIQQAAGPVSGSEERDGVAISDPGDSFEQAASAAADSVLAAGSTPTVTVSGGAAGGVAVQRDGDDDDDAPGASVTLPPADLPNFQLRDPSAGLEINPSHIEGSLGPKPLQLFGGYEPLGGGVYGGLRGDSSDNKWSAQLGVNPDERKFSAEGTFNRFNFGASAGKNGAFDLRAGYGLPLAPFSELSRPGSVTGPPFGPMADFTSDAAKASGPGSAATTAVGGLYNMKDGIENAHGSTWGAGIQFGRDEDGHVQFFGGAVGSF